MLIIINSNNIKYFHRLTILLVWPALLQECCVNTILSNQSQIRAKAIKMKLGYQNENIFFLLNNIEIYQNLS